MARKKMFIKRIKTSFVFNTLRRMVKSSSAKVGAVLFILMITICALAPLLTSYGKNEMDYTSLLKPPSMRHILGTDALGRDLWVRLLYGGRYSLLLGLVAATFGAFVGIIIGSIAGFFGGKVETIIMRIMDIWSSLPGILLCILISAVLGPGFIQTVIALSIGSVPGGTRMIRGQILAERSKEYLEAAESINCSNISIMFRHLLPNVVSPSIVQTTMGIGQTITMAATLSYIGLGVQPPTAEWGAMLSDARSHLMNYPYLIIFPGLFIAITVLAVNLLGDGLRDALDPKLRN
jgi:ABC-type dipeptide/oligopeptide/nickel transport system permease subunit